MGQSDGCAFILFYFTSSALTLIVMGVAYFSLLSFDVNSDGCRLFSLAYFSLQLRSAKDVVVMDTQQVMVGINARTVKGFGF
ncbi:hypothetical protein, partial [Pseudoalteromonas sp. HM-SA03]|uniref:hypothetical protein n=1 Tax=Pseudoalteromonas sp. HM-SA03 TaxID=2029678 RepID=UPI001C3E8ED1